MSNMAYVTSYYDTSTEDTSGAPDFTNGFSDFVLLNY
jgi:hypothetical protein